MVSDGNGNNGLHDLHLASRKAEEAGLRRYQAVHWLECFVGPLGISSQPSEKEFVSCLRNGLILCNAINKIHPGSVPKIVERQHLPSDSVTWDSNALPAYQYFENVKNFLAAVEKLKVPSFQASDLEREGFESGSVCRVVDCILSLKAYHELKEYYRGSGLLPKPLKSPIPPHSASKKFSGISNANHASPCRRLDLSVADDKNSVQDAIAKALVDRMLEAKENVNYSLLASLRNRDLDPVNKFRKILIDCLEGQLQNNIPELNFNSNDDTKEGSCTVALSPSILTDLPTTTKAKFVHVSSSKLRIKPWSLLKRQEKELLEIKVSLSIAKKDFEELKFQFFCDLKQIEKLVEEMSTAAQGYQKVIKENRNLCNMVQDLKGNIRVHCRIRPALDLEAKSVIDFIGEDGSMVLVDPSKPRNRKQVFQFNQVHGPMASQDELLRDIQHLIRSVMDGYSVCIFAYGHSGSGKTYTMSGLSDGSTEAKGMNYLALNDLFHLSTQRKSLVNYKIHVQMVEIYNEQIRDLLAQELSSNTSESGSHANEVTSHSVKSTEDVNTIIKRSIGSASSFSHSVFTIQVNGEDKSRGVIQGRLHLVDLAGRYDSDNSVSCFQDVITALSQKSSYIPYRNSKLTFLLKDALGNCGKALMIAHISPEADKFEETLNTIKFAQKVSTVELGATSSNKQSNEVPELKQQIENLKKTLLDKEAQSVNLNRHQTSPYKIPKGPSESTPQSRRSRRLSIENPSASKFQTTPNTMGNKSRDPKSPNQLSVRRSRRLSIENSRTGVKPSNMVSDKNKERKSPYKQSAMKSEKPTHEKTLPPRSRRLSIETPSSTRPVNSQACKEQKSPYGVLKHGGIDRTPPRPPRHGDENSSTVKLSETRGKLSKTPMSRAQHGTVRASIRARRLSLEGGTRTDPDLDPSMGFIEVDLETSLAEASSVSNSTACLSIPDSMSVISHEETVNRVSPSSYQESASTAEFTTPMTDRQILGRKEAQLNTDNSSIEYQTPSALTSGRVKESQIKKSFRSIGKLINGSDKKNHSGAQAATKGRNLKGQTEISVAVHPRTLRRQSLTGTQPTDSGDTRNCRTPPSHQSLAKTTKQWM